MKFMANDTDLQGHKCQGYSFLCDTIMLRETWEIMLLMTDILEDNMID